ncbi:MAG: hypothetical protein M1833_005006 [Piccolia ochrophora]|nr:MAG: hypothetical protein M1833_005006 [Piccolia ochrophora]
MSAMEYENDSRAYDDEQRYENDRSASPRPARRGDSPRGSRARSASPNGRMDSRGPPPDNRSTEERDSSARNPGSNLFVTGIHPSLSEADVSRLFEKYGDVEKCAIMVDPHTKESRGFGFVKMVTPEQADAAKEHLQGEVIDGRTLSIEKARRARPRTPTPGKYFGPPKRGTTIAVGGMAVATTTATVIEDLEVGAMMTEAAIATTVVVNPAKTTVIEVLIAMHHPDVRIVMEVEVTTAAAEVPLLMTARGVAPATLQLMGSRGVGATRTATTRGTPVDKCADDDV